MTGKRIGAFAGRMMVFAAVILAVFFGGCALSARGETSGTAEPYASVKHVLFISSYSESFITVDMQKTGLRDVFGKSVLFDSEYMDTRQYNTEENKELFYQMLSYKLKHHDPYDAVLLGDDAALSFAEKYQEELFPGLPLVFFCVNDMEHAEKAGENPLITGAVETFYLSDTVDIAKKFQPEAKKIIAVCDDTETGKGDQKQFLSLRGKYPDDQLEILNFSSCSLQDFREKLKQLSSDSILIYMTAFQDADGNPYTIDQTVPIITGDAPVPVYRASVGGVGSGLIGGKMVSYEDLGRQAASIVMRILNGEAVSEIPVETGGIGRYVFDVKILKKYHIRSSLIPKDAELINETPNFFQQHRQLIAVVSLILLLLSCFVIAFLYWKQKTEKKEARNLNLILKNIPAGISASMLRDGKILSQSRNQRFMRLMGTENSGQDQLILSRIHPDDAAMFRRVQQDLLEKECRRHYDFRYRPAADAKMAWYSSDACSIADKDGFLTVYQVVTDVTDNKILEAEKDRNRRIYEIAADMAGLCLWEYDIRTHRVRMSDTPATRQLRERYHIPKVISNVPDCEDKWIAESDFEKYRNIYRALERGEKQVSCEYWYKPDSEGKTRCELIRYSTVFDENGNPVSAYGIGQDVTVRKREAEYYKRWYTQLAESNPDAICSFRLNITRNLCGGGQSKYSVLAFMQGCRTAESLFRAIVSKISDEEQRKECSAALENRRLLTDFENGVTNVERDFPVLGSDGSTWWIKGIVHMVKNPETGDVEAVVTAYNITERISELQSALKIAEEANRAKSDFVSRISHDIRTPISAITSMTDFAMEDIHDPEKLRGDLEKIRASNVFLLSLINDILDISKIDSGQIELHPEPYFCADFVDNIRNIFGPVCREKGLQLEVTSDTEANGSFMDKVRMNQIVLNLVSNAVKYTPAGGKIEVCFWNRRAAGHMLHCGFDVRDNGIGMSSDFQKVMFDPFTQDEKNPERVKLAGGTGLGLAIVKRLIQLMGGSIEVKSTVGQGTVMSVRFTFPEYEQGEDEAAGKPVRKQFPEKLNGTVLLAEDNEINAEIATRILDGIGLKCIHAENGKQAVGLFGQSRPYEIRCILMDLRMPVMNGYEAASAIRALRREDAETVPIIALTADAIMQADGEQTRKDMNAYLTKPIDTMLLYKTIRELTEQSPAAG